MTQEAGLFGAGAGFFVTYVLYAMALLILSRVKAGRWLAPRPALFFVATASLLAACQLISCLMPGITAKACLTAALMIWSASAFLIFKKNED
jgi:hypothetical protein